MAATSRVKSVDPKDSLNWIELSASALKNNLDSLSHMAQGRMIAVSVKANAYGHGLAQIVSLIGKHKEISHLAVHSIEEASQCRKAGWKREIMLLGPVADSSIPAILKLKCQPVIFTLNTLERLGKIADAKRQKVRTHLKLETGTNRLGITERELPAFAKIYKKHASLGAPYGASTHFANIEDTTSHEYATYQLESFDRLVKRMTALGIPPKIKHTAASSALILFEKTRFDLVRPGIAAYGHWPSKETYVSYHHGGNKNGTFQPVLSWRTRIGQLKDVPKDSFVGYGCTYRTTAKTKLAVLPVGYYDGYPRALSNQSYVLVRGKRAPVRGRICMNLMMVDVTDIPGVKLGDRVTLIGTDGREEITAEQLALMAVTINYELLARLSIDIKRIVTR